MKAVLFSIGSRGDIEPLLALGEILKSKNWNVIYVFPEQFRELVGKGNTFYGFTKEFLDVLVANEQFKIISSRSGSFIKRLKIIFLMPS